jgi:hypothetical protein
MQNVYSFYFPIINFASPHLYFFILLWQWISSQFESVYFYKKSNKYKQIHPQFLNSHSSRPVRYTGTLSQSWNPMSRLSDSANFPSCHISLPKWEYANECNAHVLLWQCTLNILHIER